MSAVTWVVLIAVGLLFLWLLIGVCGPKTAVDTVKPGVAARAYRNTGSYGSPTWTAANSIKDATPSLPWDMQDAGSRGTRVKLKAKTRTDMKITASVRASDAAADYNAIADAAMSPTSVLDMMFLDGPITAEGARGFRAEWLVVLSGQPQEADGVIYDQFDFEPAYTTNGYPATVVMGAASAPTFTAL